MSLFGSSDTNNDASSTMASRSDTPQDQVNLVGEGTVLDGTLRADNDVRTSGRIVGTLQVDGKAMVAEGGSVEGEVYATNADIAGRVDGEIHVEERLVLKSSAQVDGRIETDRLVVEEGAEFSGECSTDGSASVPGAPGETDARSGPGGHSEGGDAPSTPDLDLPDEMPSTEEEPAG